MQAVGQLEEFVGERDAVPTGPLVDEEAGLRGLTAAADMEGVDDVRKAEQYGYFVQLRGVQLATVARPAGVEERLRADVLCRSSARRCLQMLAAYGTARSSSGTNVCCCAASASSARPRANL
jgi:hypothetical protein